MDGSVEPACGAKAASNSAGMVVIARLTGALMPHTDYCSINGNHGTDLWYPVRNWSALFRLFDGPIHQYFVV